MIQMTVTYPNGVPWSVWLPEGADLEAVQRTYRVDGAVVTLTEAPKPASGHPAPVSGRVGGGA